MKETDAKKSGAKGIGANGDGELNGGKLSGGKGSGGKGDDGEWNGGKGAGAKKSGAKGIGMIDIKRGEVKRVLTIAGSDCSGGAGIQADIKTITSLGMYAMSAITALTAQNTTGVYGVLETPPEFVANQLDCIFRDIRPDAVKIGMVSGSGIIRVIADKLAEYGAENIVVDPVMVSTSGSRLLSEEAMEALVARLLPLGTVITPNIPEAEALCGFSINTREDMESAAAKIAGRIPGGALIKGGHLRLAADDLLCVGSQGGEPSMRWFPASRIDNPNTHGTGCTLSSAIACGLAQGCTLEESIQKAKAYITGALDYGLDLGEGSGPLNHMWAMEGAKLSLAQ